MFYGWPRELRKNEKIKSVHRDRVILKNERDNFYMQNLNHTKTIFYVVKEGSRIILQSMERTVRS
jgi:hypothetical protein